MSPAMMPPANQPLHLTRRHYGFSGFNVSPAAAQVNGVVRGLESPASVSWMLALDDDRWERLTTFFPSGKDLPKVLKQWLASIGSDEEPTIYGRDLFDLFLHQATITNAAFAVVPWLVDVCKKGKTKHRVEYLTDVALVEANRLKYGVYFNRKETVESPEWLMPDYHQAIVDARDLVDDALDAEPDQEWKRGLMKLRPALHGDAELAWSQWHAE